MLRRCTIVHASLCKYCTYTYDYRYCSMFNFGFAHRVSPLRPLIITIMESYSRRYSGLLIDFACRKNDYITMT